MNKRKIIIIGIIVAVLALLVYLLFGRSEPVGYREAALEKGNLVVTVSSSGTVNPVAKVEVGSQVSGLIKSIYVDYNSEVHQGQVIAQIDPEPFELKVRQAQADLDSARASIMSQQINFQTQKIEVDRVFLQLEEARRDMARNQALLDKEFISKAAFDTIKTTYQTTQRQYESAKSTLDLYANQIASAQATARQRQAQLEIAQTDLSHTRILSPVNGVVISREIDEGQTVAASFQAPKLFEIAENLAEMQVEANIDEADVGRIKPGQTATFTVDAYPNRPFTGQIQQIRKAPTVTSNVTTYTALIGVSNPDLVLLPGMTANIKILTDQRQDVLLAPNSALRFRPPATAEKASVSTDSSATAKADSKLVETRYTQIKSLFSQVSLTSENQQKADRMLNEFKQKGLELAKTLNQSNYTQRINEMVNDLVLQLASLLSEEDLSKFQNLSAQLIEKASREKGTFGTVWVLENNALKPIRVRTGLTDGAMTEVSGDGIEAGMNVVIGLSATGTSTRQSSASARPPRM